MKQFKFNHNDYVTVTLTKEGADHINKKRKELYEQFPMLKRDREDYVEGGLCKVQFWVLVNYFHEMLHIGMMSPFELGEITVESSL